MNIIPLMLDGAVISEGDITSVYVSGRKLQQEIILDDQDINELEDEILDLEYTERSNDEFLKDNRWPDTWRL